ncbi:MAG: SAM-dependent chlorinase/fluorinase [Phycisphaerae bacterium]|nr:SAM-dependent chlorinase/fluorinase [Phycisphaerae bacterium]
MATITLTSDFGLADYHVGAIKGIILQIVPDVRLVDITHEIAPHDVLGGALVLREAWRAFAPGTIHVAIVDPGVGSQRKIILAQYGRQYLLVPDNGLITLIHQISPPERLFVVANEALFCQPVSPTFHGRDVFAPVAAHLARGLKPEQIGPETNLVNLLELPVEHLQDGNKLVGRVIHVDRFGNLVTDLSADELRRFVRKDHVPEVRVANRSMGPIRVTFADVPAGEPVAYIGSAGFLEVAFNQKRADHELSAGKGTAVEVV